MLSGGSWGPWQQCSGGTFAIAMWPKVHLLKLGRPNGENMPLIHLSDATTISLQDIRSYKNERTGLTGLTLVCEGSNVVRSESWGGKWRGIGHVNNRIGHEYQSNDADCSNYPGNYIRGVRMQYDMEEQRVQHLFPPFEIDRPAGRKKIWTGTSLGTMIFNFALACTRDFSESVRFENILRYIPEIPGGIKDVHPNR